MAEQMASMITIGDTSRLYCYTYTDLRNILNTFTGYKEMMTITFNTGEYGTRIPSRKVLDGERIKELNYQIDSTAGKQITKWYTDQEMTTEVTTNTRIHSDITLYAKWEDIQ